MTLRIKLARLILRLNAIIQTLPVVVMRPDDLVEFSRQSYAKQPSVEGWAEDSLVDSGLHPDELDLLTDISEKTGQLLLLGVGGGREAIPLAQMGYKVTGLDYVPGMVERAIENADQRGFRMEGLVQEISKLEVPAAVYEVVWMSRSMYSCVPTRARRVAMVKKITQTLKPGGYFLCQFQRDTTLKNSRKGLFLRRLIAALTLGNLAYQDGDMLWLNVEFLHAFGSDDEIRLELEEGGLEVVRFQTEVNPTRAGVVCRKSH